MLDETFRRRDVVSKTRHVRTPDGAKFFDLPIGAPITPGAVAAAKARHGTAQVNQVLRGADVGAKPRVGNGPAAPRAAAAVKPGKLAPAKNDYDKRVDKFLRAIDQAVRSDDPKEGKRVHDLIGQDYALKKPERDDLQGVLAARLKGAPDPAPRPGTNRAKRGGVGGDRGVAARPAAPGAPDAPAPAQAARDAAQAAPNAPAAKKAAAKKIPAKKAVPQRRVATPDIQAAVDRHVGAGAAKKATTPPKEPSGPKNGPETKAYEAIQAAKNEDDLPKIVADINEAQQAGKIDRQRWVGVLAEVQRKRAEIRAGQANVDGGNPPARTIGQRIRDAIAVPRANRPGTTSHGQRTKAWKRLVARDINNADTPAKMDRLEQQIDNMHARGRISTREHAELRALAQRKREGEARRIAQGQEDRANKVADRIKNDIAALKNKDEAAAFQVKAEDQSALKGQREIRAEINRLFQEKKRELDKPGTVQPPSRPGAARERAMRNRPSPDAPDAQPGSSKAYSEEVRNADSVPALDRVIDRLEADRDLSDEENNRIVGLINARKMAVKKNPEYLKAKGFFKTPDDIQKAMEAAFSGEQLDALLAVSMDHKDTDTDDFSRRATAIYDRVNAELDRVREGNGNLAGYSHSDAPEDNNIEALHALVTHFDGGKGSIQDAPSAGLWNFIQINPDRFEVKAKTDAAGITPKFVVTDKKSGEKYWVKGDATRHGVVANGAAKEAFAAQVMQAFGLNVPSAVVGQHGALYDDHRDGEGKFFLQRDYGNFLGDSGAIKDRAYQQGDINALANGPEPQGLLNLLLMDYLFDNRDRHGGNMMVFQHENGDAKVAYLDLGLGFGGFNDEYTYRSFENWYSGQGRNREWGHLLAAKEALGNRTDTTERVRAAAQKMLDVKWEEIKKIMVKQGMSPEDVDRWIDVLQQRAKHLRDEAGYHFAPPPVVADNRPRM